MLIVVLVVPDLPVTLLLEAAARVGTLEGLSLMLGVRVFCHHLDSLADVMTQLTAVAGLPLSPLSHVVPICLRVA